MALKILYFLILINSNPTISVIQIYTIEGLQWKGGSTRRLIGKIMEPEFTRPNFRTRGELFRAFKYQDSPKQGSGLLTFRILFPPIHLTCFSELTFWPAGTGPDGDSPLLPLE